MKFHVIVAMYNVEDWIEENIQFLKNQTSHDFQVLLIDDISTDKTVELVEAAIQGDNRFKLILNREKNIKLEMLSRALKKQIQKMKTLF